MDTLTKGTLTLSMVVTVPHPSRSNKIKQVTLARYNYVNKNDAEKLKAKFIHSNDELVSDYITARWSFVTYL